MSIKKNVFLVTALLFILYLVFPLFADIIQIPVWLPSIVTVAILVYLYPKAFANNTFYWFLVYAIVLAIYVLIGRPLTIGIGTVQDRKKIFIEIAFILPTISISSVLLFLKDWKVTYRLYKWSLFFLYVSFIITVPLMIRYNSIREALALQDMSIRIPGLPGYSLMHAYTLLLPALCYGAKVFQGQKKKWLIVGLLILCFVIYDTFVTTSLIIMVFIVLMTMLHDRKHVNLIFIIIPIIALIFIVLYKAGVFISLIDWIMPWFENTPVEKKLLDFKKSMIEESLVGGQLVGRQNLHAISWHSFFQNPFFGTSVVGGHSSLIDRFGGMGFVAGLPFVMIFISFIKRMVKMYDTKTAKIFFWIGTISAFVFLYQKGNWGSEAWLMYMVLMPMGIKTFENKVLFDESKAS